MVENSLLLDTVLNTPVLSDVKYHRNYNHGIWLKILYTYNLDTVLNTLSFKIFAVFLNIHYLVV